MHLDGPRAVTAAPSPATCLPSGSVRCLCAARRLVSGPSVGYKIGEVASRTVAGGPSPKAVLNAMARRACDACGLTWTGVDLIAADTELGRTTVRESLAKLVSAGLLVAARFPNGGRGLSTEYLVLTQVMELSPAPCGQCAARMKNPPPAGAFARLSGKNPPPAGAFSGVSDPKPTGLGAQNPPPAGDHHTDIIHQSERQDETSLTLGQSFDHPADDPRARQAAKDALETVRGFQPPEPRQRP